MDEDKKDTLNQLAKMATSNECGTPPVNQAMGPCPHCGYCPTCGKPYNYTPYYPPYNPYPYPNITWGKL